MGSIADRLADLGITLPEAAVPLASYVPARRGGGLLHLSGHLTKREGHVVSGRLGDDLDTGAGHDLARLIAIDLLGSAAAALGGIDAVTGVVRLGGFVQCTPDFTEQPQVINGASDLLVEVFGSDRGAHARSAVGVAALPLGAAVEIEAVFEVS